MRIVKIAEAQGMVGEVLPSITGTLVALYDQKTGTSKAGDPWTLQNGLVKDETGEMKITFSGHEPISLRMKGEAIQIISRVGNHGMNGIKVKQNEWKGKVTNELWITPTASIAFPNAEGNAAASHEDVRAEQTKRPAPLPDYVGPNYIEPKVDGTTKARMRLQQFASLYTLCLKAARFVAKTEVLSDEDTRQVATAFFIQSTREGLENGLPNNHPLISDKELAPDDLPFN